LNELYRSFRLGNVFTLANDKLLAERLTGGEVGGSLSAFNKKLTMRGTFLWNIIARPIANVTLSATPALITRERENLGRTQSRGVEFSVEAHPWERVTLSGGYQYTDAIVLDFSAERALQGLQIPQVPRQQFTLQARYAKPSRWTVAIQGRFCGVQFDDDLNTLPLNHFFVLDVFASYPLTARLDSFVTVENLTDRRYAVARTPVEMLGPPLLINVGLRMHLKPR
jgi:outer membrane receptor protein involved in Fe transport